MEQTLGRTAFDNYVNDGGYTEDLYEFHQIDEGIESLVAATGRSAIRTWSGTASWRSRSNRAAASSGPA